MKDLHLPALLQQIANVAGVDAALAVAKQCGGTRAYISHDPKPNHWLSLLLGADKAKLIGAALNAEGKGDVFLIPMGPSRSTAERWREIERLYEDEGLSKEQIAQRVGCHYRTVYRVLNGYCKGARHAKAQIDLFTRAAE